MAGLALDGDRLLCFGFAMYRVRSTAEPEGQSKPSNACNVLVSVSLPQVPPKTLSQGTQPINVTGNSVAESRYC